MFQGKTDRINGLDNAIMQVHANAITFFQNGQTAALHIKAGVLHGGGRPGTDGLQELNFQFIQRAGVAGGNAHGAERSAPAVERYHHDLVDADFFDLRVELGQIFVGQV
ncbi:hypothetical protein SDC9_141682 [bioreactor metagenome]|uniref:Uncharacterized protein n=1 Tax=bioreactor metagenome TaxID=1076179 RepID=A0A645DYW4_9ZZZZ